MSRKSNAWVILKNLSPDTGQSKAINLITRNKIRVFLRNSGYKV